MKVIKLEEVDSTNSYAKLNINTLEDKTVIHALKQYSGRGRFDRKWVDLGKENLFFSIVLKPSEKYIDILSNVTQYACIVLCEILEKYGINPQIKWPNDVMIDGERKISGILSESVIEGGKLKGLVVGIGVNLNANIKDIENIKDRTATSLNIEIGKAVNMDYFLEEFLSEFFKNYDNLLNKGFTYIKENYKKRNCFLNKDLSVQVLNEIKSGYATDINDRGELVLRTRDNEELTLSIGDIL